MKEKLRVFKNCNGEVVITSLIIAEETKQLHKKVMEDMRKWLIPTGTLKGLVEKHYKDAKGEERPYYELDKYQFMLYAMHKKGYDDWKQQIVEEYKAMEQYILETNQRNQFLEWRSQEAHDTRDFHSFIDNDKKCMGLCKELKAMVAYKYNLKYIYSKEMYFQEYLSKHNQEYWLYYLKLRTDAENFTKAFKSLDNESYMHNVIVALQNNYINNIEEFKEYKNNHESIDEFPKQFGRPHIE